MLKKIFTILKKIIMAVFLLYGYNLLAAPLNFIIPINIITVSLVTILGVPALLSLILVLVVVFWKKGFVCWKIIQMNNQLVLK